VHPGGVPADLVVPVSGHYEDLRQARLTILKQKLELRIKQVQESLANPSIKLDQEWLNGTIEMLRKEQARLQELGGA